MFKAVSFLVALSSAAVLSVSAPAQDVTTYTYDEDRAGYRNIGRLTTVANGAATIRKDYTARGLLAREAWDVDGQTYERTYSYDSATRLIRRQFSDGEVWPSASGSYTYDSGGQLTSIPGVIDEITYNANQDPVRMVFSNGVSTDYTYDGDRLWLLGSQTSAGVTALFDETYTRDTMGRMTQVRSNRQKGNWDYAYDELDQLLSASNLDDATLTQSFTYDEAGNMTYNSALGSYSYPAATAPRPHAPTDVAGQALTYDRNGNMLSGMGRTIAYDAADRPVTVTANGQTTTYVYGPDDKRLKKITGGNTTLYLGDDEEHLSDGTVIKHIDGTVRRVGSVSNWMHRDHLSSVRLMTDATGTQIAENRYRPYGERTDVQLAVNTPRESRGWIGERDDPETGLTYLNARYYDPALGRFITPDWFDPTDRGVGTNRYAYGMNNPIMLKDPSGNRVNSTGPLGRLDGGNSTYIRTSIASGGVLISSSSNSKTIGNTDNMTDPIWKEARCKICTIPSGSPLAGQDPNLGGMRPGEVDRLEGELQSLLVRSSTVYSLMRLFNESAEEDGETPAESKGGTYGLIDPETGEIVRTGRTKDLKTREKQHASDPETGDLIFDVDRRTDSYPAQRGREQIIYDNNPGAQKENGGLNKIRPISPRNKRREEYLREGEKLR